MELNDDKFDKLITSALEKESEFDLPANFADRIVMMAKVRTQKETSRDRLWLVFGIISMIGALVFVFTKVKFTANVGVFTFVQNYWGLVVFGVLFVTALHFVDKLILRKQESG